MGSSEVKRSHPPTLPPSPSSHSLFVLVTLFFYLSFSSILCLSLLSLTFFLPFLFLTLFRFSLSPSLSLSDTLNLLLSFYLYMYLSLLKALARQFELIERIKHSVTWPCLFEIFKENPSFIQPVLRQVQYRNGWHSCRYSIWFRLILSFVIIS